MAGNGKPNIVSETRYRHARRLICLCHAGTGIDVFTIYKNLEMYKQAEHDI